MKIGVIKTSLEEGFITRNVSDGTPHPSFLQQVAENPPSPQGEGFFHPSSCFADTSLE
ncbi:MAG: hypothetical protein IKD39_08750 [Oscillospiraceae bacterium]|nr:hypothetical protein [Oscillospiraceae bacterium]